jgi:hypothetical protein
MVLQAAKPQLCPAIRGRWLALPSGSVRHWRIDAHEGVPAERDHREASSPGVMKLRAGVKTVRHNTSRGRTASDIRAGEPARCQGTEKVTLPVCSSVLRQRHSTETHPNTAQTHHSAPSPCLRHRYRLHAPSSPHCLPALSLLTLDRGMDRGTAPPCSPATCPSLHS